jgi:flagellar protein FliL
MLTGKKVIDRMVITASLLATLATAAVFLYTEIIYQKQLPQNKTEFNNFIQNQKQTAAPSSVKLKNIIVNLKSRTSRLRFLDVEIHLIPFSVRYEESINQNLNVIYDTIIDMTSGQDPDYLNTVMGKEKLSSELRSAINELLRKNIIKEILFTKFIIM